MANRVLRLAVVLFLASILFVPAEATAAAISWNTTATSNDWAVAANWSSGTAPTHGDDLTFTTSNQTAIVNRDTNAKSITFDTTAADFSFSVGGSGGGGGTMFFTGKIEVNGGNQTFNAPVRANGTSFSVINNGTGLLDFNSEFMSNNDKNVTATIGGSGNIEFKRLSRRSSAYDMVVIKTGTGTVSILEEYTTPASGSQGAYTGSTTINGGTLSIVGEGSLGGNPTEFNAGHLTLNGGTLLAARSFAIDDSNRGITIGPSGGTFQVGSGLTLTIANPIVGNGILGKTGAGTLALSGNGLSTTAMQVDEGTMTIANGLAVGDLHVGFDGRSASLTVTSGNVAVGASGNRADLHVGRTTGDPASGQHSQGTLNLAAASQFTAWLDNFTIGVRTTEGESSYAVGTVVLAESNYIDATTILISQNQMWTIPTQSMLTLGSSNTIKTDTFTVGGSRGNALVAFGAPGGTLDLTGSSGAAANLYVGNCTLNTGNPTTAVMNLGGGTFNASLDKLVVGFRAHRSGQTPETTATLTFDAGTVTANSVTIGDGTVSGADEGKGVGTVNMGGGTLQVAGSITLGTRTSVSEGAFRMSGGTATVAGGVLGGTGSSAVQVNGGTLSVGGEIAVDTLSLAGGSLHAGTITVAPGAAFDFLGGTLRVGTFNGNLLQGGGTLSPGNSPGITTVNGDYALGADGTLEIDIQGLVAGSQYDQLVVNGNVNLAGSLNVLLDAAYSPTYSDLFWIVNNTGENSTTSGTFAGIAQGEAFLVGDRSFYVYYGANYETQSFYGGNDVLLTTIPEPGTLLMLIAPLAMAACLRRRRACHCRA